MRSQLLLVSLCLALLGSCEQTEKKVKTSKSQTEVKDTPADFAGESLQNIPYQFRLTQPGSDWKLLEQEDARMVTSDAQAALSKDTGLTAVVIVEHVPGMTLEQMSKLILESMPIEEKSIDVQETETFVGLPAVRYQIAGKVNEVPMHYRGRIFMRGDYAYQLVAFAPAELAADEEWQSIFSAFSLSEGEIRPVQDDTPSPDMIGVGWRLKDGIFESAVSGLRVSPQNGWRAVVGAEARRMNADAEVVLVRQAPDAYFLVIPERIGKTSPEAYVKNRVDSTALNLKGEVEQTPIKSVLLGKEVTATELSSSESPWTFQVGVGFQEGWAVQATGWYTAGIGVAGRKALADAMQAVSLMPKASTTALRNELLAAPDEQDAVGSAFSLRAGIFRDYEHGVVWKKPKGFWEVSVGQEVREINPIAQLYARYLNSAMHIMVVAETGTATLSANAYHESCFAGVQANLKMERLGAVKSSRIGSCMALQTDATTTTGGVELSYRVVTAVLGQQGVQLHIWGESTGMREHATAADQAAKTLELHASLPPDEMRKGIYMDHRLGFSMKLDRKYKYHDTTPKELAGIGSYPTWGVDGADWVGVLAIRAIEAGRDREWSMNQMEERIRDSFAKIVSGAQHETEETTLLGQPARHLTWKTTALRLDAYLIRRHQTIYALATTDAGGDSGMIKLAVKGFQLID